MKKNKIIGILFLIGILLGSIYIFSSNKESDFSTKDDTLPSNTPNPSTEKDFNSMTTIEKVEYRMKNMTLEEKIAQMLVVYYTGNTVDDNLKNTLTTVRPGGFILMKDNITTYDNTKKFVDDLKKYSEIPMIISIDQEGGMVQRLKNLSDVSVTQIPSMYDLGKTKDTSLAYRTGKVMAEEMRTLGINVVYAPVLDIYSNENNTVIGNRSFGHDAKTVAEMAISLAKGLEDNGVIATFKHFPGHGDTETDSHVNLPIISKTYEELVSLELKPFEQAIESGAKIIMIGHIALPNVTNDNTPASLSKTIITDILKEKLGYEGLVITDALNMGALTKNYSIEEIYTKAIQAGVDLLLMPNGSKQAVEFIKNNISEDRINESVEKILTFKYTYLEEDNSLDKSYLGSNEHKQIISEIGS